MKFFSATGGMDTPSMRICWMLFGIALGLRLALLWGGPWEEPKRACRDDSGRYLVLSHNLRTYNTFGKKREDGLVHNAMARLRAANGTLSPPDADGLRPESFRTPGYPLFIAAIELLGGDL